MPLPQRHRVVRTVELRQDHHRKIQDQHERGRHESTSRNHDEDHACTYGPRYGVEPSPRVCVAKIPLHSWNRAHSYGIPCERRATSHCQRSSCYGIPQKKFRPSCRSSSLQQASTPQKTQSFNKNVKKTWQTKGCKVKSCQTKTPSLLESLPCEGKDSSRDLN